MSNDHCWSKQDALRMQDRIAVLEAEVSGLTRVYEEQTKAIEGWRAENQRMREALQAILARSGNDLNHKSLIQRSITPYPNIDVFNYARAALTPADGGSTKEASK